MWLSAEGGVRTSDTGASTSVFCDVGCEGRLRELLNRAARRTHTQIPIFMTAVVVEEDQAEDAVLQIGRAHV